MRLPTALPHLSGRWLTAYRILWFAMLALALIGMTIGVWFSRTRTMAWDQAFYGAGIRSAQSDGRVTWSPVGSAATQAGVRPHSSLLAIDGVRFPNDDGIASIDSVAKAIDGPDGRVLRLTFRTRDGNVSDHRLVRGPQHLAEADANAPMSYRSRIAMYLLFQFTISFAFLTAAILLFRRRVSDPVVALLAFGLLSPMAASAAAVIPNLALAQAAGDLINMVGQTAVLLAIIVFPSGRFEPRWSLVGVPVVLAGMAAQLWSPTPEIKQSLGVLLLLVILAIIARRFSLLPAGLPRQQVKWAALGFALFAVLMLVTLPILLLDQRTNDNWEHFVLLIAMNSIQALAMLALVGGLLISLLRYRLYDADAAISRSAVYAALTVSLLAIFAGTEKFIEIMGEQYFGASIGSASGAIAAGFAAVMIAPLHGRMSDWAERRFQRNLIRLRRELPLMVGDLRETASPEQLADFTLERIASGVRASNAALVVVNGGSLDTLSARDVDQGAIGRWLADWTPSQNHERLDCERDDKQFPIRVPLHVDPAGSVGWILLGPRPDGSFYGKDERDALLEIADSVARGIAVARLREEREASHRSITESLTGRVSVLERFIARMTATPPAASA